MKLSVAICAHNPRRNYLTRVLNALSNQSLDAANWELLLVDNASNEPLADSYDLSWHPHSRHIQVSQLGIAVARRRAFEEAAGDVIVFVDDDNVLDFDYLSYASRIGDEWPQLGVWGCSIEPEFEVPPSDHLSKFLSVLALRKVEAPLWSNVSICSDAEPWGAGMCIRASVAAAYCSAFDASPIRLGRQTGISMVPGEDTEMCMIACHLGWGMGIFPELKLTHLIPADRVTEDYILRAAEGIATSSMLIGYKWRGTVPQSPFSPKRLCFRSDASC